MLFNSYEFIFLFLPITIIIYYLLGKTKWSKLANVWLIIVSLFFYSYWNVKYLPLLLGSILMNYICSGFIINFKEKNKNIAKLAFGIGVIFNIGLLGFYKYMDFFIENLNIVIGSNFNLLHIVLPLGISFFTITQLVYLVDCYKGIAKDHDFISYSLFVVFFPHLLAGPILYHKPMMEQFENRINRLINWENFTLGFSLFILGLAKKVIIADTLSSYVGIGFSNTADLTLVDAWLTSLSYTFQLYFDFSGYSDMALGLARMLNINIPINFNSPYKAISISDFWRRWHMSLSSVIKNYIYIPLGGNRNGFVNKLKNLFIAMFICGIWHGAGWTFVIWGAMHGIALVINNIWNKYGFSLPKILGWLITFNFINIAWVIFRADSTYDALNIIQAMFGLHGIILNGADMVLKGGKTILVIFLMMAIILSIFGKNSNEFINSIKYNKYVYIMLGIILFIVLKLMLSISTEFLYFQF